MKNPQSGCLVCGQPLVYQSNEVPVVCACCGSSALTLVSCEHGHFVCDNCHRGNAFDWIEQVCATTLSTNPDRLAYELMDSPLLAMHGPEHHFLVPAVLIAAACNANQRVDEKRSLLRKARTRAEKVPGGFCGSHGSCGAAVGAGIFMSVYTGATPLSHAEWRLSNVLTGQCLISIGQHGGPRCCKRNSLLALEIATAYSVEQAGIFLEMDRAAACHYSSANRDCLKAACPFYTAA